MRRNPDKLSISILPSYLQDLNEKARASPIQLSPDSDVALPLPRPSRWKLWTLLSLTLVGGAAFMFGFDERLRTRPSSLPIRYSKALSLSCEDQSLVSVKTEEKHANWRENLLPELKYITGGPFGGTSNQIHGLTNLIYLAALTKRVALLPSLEPGWVQPATYARYSDFWDLERFTRSSGIPVLELSEIRDNITSTVPPEADHIGCWSNAEVVFRQHTEASTLEIHNIKSDLWPMPESLQRQPEYGNEMAFQPLRAFDLQRSAREDWIALFQSDRDAAAQLLQATTGRKMPELDAAVPTEQLLCFDNYFYLHSVEPDSPAYQSKRFGRERASWEAVGQYLHWNAPVDAAVDDILSEVFGSANEPFVAIHMRRGDFGKGRTVQAYARALYQLYDEMRKPAYAKSAGPLPAKFEPRDLPVFVVTDEDDPAFRASLGELGWKQYDHNAAGTASRMGPWWPSILDAALLSRAHGLVGTGGSTYSYQAILRAQAWQGAAYVWA